jgi:23S rRNA pseudouridine1911/1915/1917 synthase
VITGGARRAEEVGAAPLCFVVGESEAGQRVDRALAELGAITRSEAQRWIDAGLVCVNAAPARASRRVQAGDALEARPPEPLPSPLAPEPIALRILHEDEDVIAVDKPAGLVVHPAPGHPGHTLVNALLHHCGNLAGVGGVLRPGIVHRLDRGTSGVMVAAKHDAAHRSLAAQFHQHSIERVYLALVRGLPAAETGRVDRPIGRHPRDRKRMSVHARHGREARTAWRVQRRFAAAGLSWLEVRPETGRTHQIRVHLAAAGIPIAGDAVYGRDRGREHRLERPALHAWVLGFTHPRSGERLRLEAPLPPDLAALLEDLGRREEGR